MVLACSSGTYFDQCAATLECHAADTGHGTLSRLTVQTRGRPVAVLSFDVERHTGIYSYPFQCLLTICIDKLVQLSKSLFYHMMS